MLSEIKLSVKSRLSSDLRGSHIIIGKFHEACEHLDASIFEPFIKEDDVFEDVGKWAFLQSLWDLFQESQHDLELNSVIRRQGTCKMCNKGQAVTEYLVPGTTMVLFAYYFELKDGQLKDIYRCNASSGCGL